MNATCGAGIAYPLGALELAPVLLHVLVGFLLKLLIFTFLVPCCGVPRKTYIRFVLIPICFVGGYVLLLCYL